MRTKTRGLRMKQHDVTNLLIQWLKLVAVHIGVNKVDFSEV